MRNLNYLLILFFAVSLFQSCVKDNDLDTEKGVAPELPPIASFVMPFDGYEKADTTGFTTDGAGLRTTISFKNWFFAASNVTIWHAITSLTMAVPVASFAEAFNHQATYEGNGIWLWAYDFEGDNGRYQAELRGSFPDAQHIEWEMTISKTGSFQDVIWYTGLTDADGNSGIWNLNHQPFNPEPFIKIAYRMDPLTDNSQISYTNIIPNNPNNGDYIEYSEIEDGSRPLNRIYDIFQIQEDNLLEVQWNHPTNEGRVKNFKFFNDEEWHCWDSSAMDTDC